MGSCKMNHTQNKRIELVEENKMNEEIGKVCSLKGAIEKNHTPEQHAKAHPITFRDTVLSICVFKLWEIWILGLKLLYISMTMLMFERHG